MELLAPEPPFELYDPAWPILTLPEQLPPAKLVYAAGQQGFVANALLAGGVVVRGATVTNSVLAGNVHVDAGTLLDQVVALPGVRVSANCKLRRVIIDAGVEIPDGTCIGAQSAAPPLEPLRAAGRITLVARNWTMPLDEDEMRSVA
jgi:glucose-1-phosphate adenylyltransferase